MFLGMNNTRLEIKIKILIILDFENGVLPTYLPLCLAGRSPEQLVIDLIAQHQRFVVCCSKSRIFFPRVEDLTTVWKDIVEVSSKNSNGKASKKKPFIGYYGSRVNVAEMSGNFYFYKVWIVK